jgi:hypothetical protein
MHVVRGSQPGADVQHRRGGQFREAVQRALFGPSIQERLSALLPSPAEQLHRLGIRALESAGQRAPATDSLPLDGPLLSRKEAIAVVVELGGSIGAAESALTYARRKAEKSGTPQQVGGWPLALVELNPGKGGPGNGHRYKRVKLPARPTPPASAAPAPQ